MQPASEAKNYKHDFVKQKKKKKSQTTSVPAVEQAEKAVKKKKKKAGIRFACRLKKHFIYITMQMCNEQSLSKHISSLALDIFHHWGFIFYRQAQT